MPSGQPISSLEKTTTPDQGAALEQVISQKVTAIEQLDPSFKAARAAVEIDQEALVVVEAAKAAAQKPEVVGVYELAVARAKRNLAADVKEGEGVQAKITEAQKSLAENLAELKKVKPESPLAALAEAA